MEQQTIDEILASIRKLLSENVSVEIKKTQRRSDVWLIIFTWTNGLENIDDWAIKQVYPLQWNKINPVIESHHCFRAIHCLENKFVFFARFDGVFCKFEKPLDYDVYGGAPNHTIYVGECLAIDDVINYITENRNVIF